MKSIQKNIKIIAVISILAIGNTSVFAQCKSAIQDGIIKLDPYNFDGQINSPTVKAGRPGEVHLTFYRGRSYKLQINPEAEYAGKVNFRVLDVNKKEIYNSATGGDQTNSWTFFSNSAQELIIEVTSTERSKHCVAVLVGVKIPKNTNSMRDL